jgi:hypothetical protein
MPTLVILATHDTALADAWERQLPPGRLALRLASQPFAGGNAPGFAAVVVLDAVAEGRLPAALARCPTIYVGEPRSLPFEQARLSGRARVFLSYEESATRLKELLPLIEEVAEKQSLLDMLKAKNRRLEPPPAHQRLPVADGAELWDFLEAAMETIDTRERLVAEFRRASRHLLRASHAVFFLREADGFRADRGTAFFPIEDPLVGFFENFPAIIDGTNWENPADPLAELEVRNRLALWGARLLVPVHDNGRLLGLVALGVRDDGQPYDESDRIRAVFFARLLRHLLAKSEQFTRLTRGAEQTALGAKYLPGTLMLGPQENPPRHVPLVVRDLIGHARRTRQVTRVAPSLSQPFRASAGIVTETGGVWASWEDATGELQETAQRERAGRREMLRELSLTLSHELGNALVSLATFRQTSGERAMPASLIETMKSDVEALEALNDNLSVMHELHEAEPAAIEIRDLAQTIGHSLGLKVEVGQDPILINASKRLLDYAIRALITAVGVSRREHGLKDLTLKVRATGVGDETTALLSLKGKNMELEGILPEPMNGDVPNQGRLGVFLAKEILRLHRGEIHAGPGMEGTEILISVKRL